MNYAREQNIEELVRFLENVDEYQVSVYFLELAIFGIQLIPIEIFFGEKKEKIQEFHQKIDKNDYFGVKATYKIDMQKFGDLFNSNLLFSYTVGSSQSIFHKCVLNGYYQILELVLELMNDNLTKITPKLDSIRDHVITFNHHIIQKNIWLSLSICLV